LLHKLIILLNKLHFLFIVCLIKSLELLRRQQLSIVQKIWSICVLHGSALT